ncbi:MAG: hypothetical protein M1833_005594 [Piccolia ochrophora]|nr:MAG: hypothetical protein M1833_005594 [Piccolia ochrophora]
MSRPSFTLLVKLLCGCISCFALEDPSLYARAFTRQLLASSASYGNFSGSPTPGDITVGIVGAGAAGLYSTILLESLGISCEILEADSRPGGRIWTHYFDEEQWKKSRPGEPAYYDYFQQIDGDLQDVGAMRIPRMPYMDRIIGDQNYSLVNFLNTDASADSKVHMIPFIFNTDNTFSLYNNVLRQFQDGWTGDPYHIGAAPQGPIPESFASLNPRDVWAGVIKDFTDALNASFVEGTQRLFELDSMSVREYLQVKGYHDSEIDWLETTNDASGHYDLGLSGAVLEDWIFSAAPSTMWTAVEGGFSRIIEQMVKCIRSKINLSQRVSKISFASETLLNVQAKMTTYQYNHVINTVPLGPMQAMDMRDLGLDYTKRAAIRSLNYDGAAKIGMKFKTRWWESLPQPFKGGQSLSDLPIRACVYPSYGVDTPNAAAAMVASYTWGQDAARIGSYLATPEARSHLVQLTLRNLAQMNNVTEEFLSSQFVDAFAFSWYNSDLAQGAFALFGPSEFTNLLPALLQPAANGRLHFAGEALSTGTGWVIGALNSAYRAVAEILARENRIDLLEALVAKWGLVDEIDMGWYHSAAPPEGLETPTEPSNDATSK